MTKEGQKNTKSSVTILIQLIKNIIYAVENIYFAIYMVLIGDSLVVYGGSFYLNDNIVSNTIISL